LPAPTYTDRPGFTAGLPRSSRANVGGQLQGSYPINWLFPRATKPPAPGVLGNAGVRASTR
jgi:hypothetical protein